MTNGGAGGGGAGGENSSETKHKAPESESNESKTNSGQEASTMIPEEFCKKYHPNTYATITALPEDDAKTKPTKQACMAAFLKYLSPAPISPVSEHTYTSVQCKLSDLEEAFNRAIPALKKNLLAIVQTAHQPTAAKPLTETVDEGMSDAELEKIIANERPAIDKVKPQYKECAVYECILHNSLEGDVAVKFANAFGMDLKSYLEKNKASTDGAPSDANEKPTAKKSESPAQTTTATVKAQVTAPQPQEPTKPDNKKLGAIALVGSAVVGLTATAILMYNALIAPLNVQIDEAGRNYDAQLKIKQTLEAQLESKKNGIEQDTAVVEKKQALEQITSEIESHKKAYAGSQDAAGKEKGYNNLRDERQKEEATLEKLTQSYNEAMLKNSELFEQLNKKEGIYSALEEERNKIEKDYKALETEQNKATEERLAKDEQNYQTKITILLKKARELNEKLKIEGEHK